MKDNEIIELLEYIRQNGSGACDKCPVFPCGKIKDYEDNQCGRFIAEKALDLIKRKQAEIERLEKTEIEIDDFFCFLCHMRMLNGDAIASYEDLQNYIQQEKSEAVKEFSKAMIDKIKGGKISSDDIADFTVVYLGGKNNGKL